MKNTKRYRLIAILISLFSIYIVFICLSVFQIIELKRVVKMTGGILQTSSILKIIVPFIVAAAILTAALIGVYHWIAIKERKIFHELEENLKEKAEHTNHVIMSMAEAMASGLIAYEMESKKIILFNREAMRIYEIDSQEELERYKRDNMLSKQVLVEDSYRVREATQKLKNVGDHASYEYRIRRKDGTATSILAQTSIMQGESGKKIVVSSISDATEHAKLRNDLRFEQSQYREAILKRSELAFMFDVTEGILRKDSFLRTKQLRKYNVWDMLPIGFDEGMEKWNQIMQPVQMGSERRDILNSKNMLDAYNRGERVLETEYYYHKNQNYYRCMVLLSEREETNHVYACVIVYDITTEVEKEKKIQEELRMAAEEAKRANQAKSEFLARMSHDIRTPINGIMGMLNIIKKNRGNEERVDDCLEKIDTSAGFLLMLINDVLNMSRLESGKTELVVESFNIRELLMNCIKITQGQAAESGVNLYDDFPEKIEHERLFGSTLHIRQIFLNIISNGVKYNKVNGYVKIGFRELPMKGDKAVFEFKIEDNGIGMSKEYLEHLFEPFTQEDASIRSIYKGTGLGMSIVQKLIEVMGGTISVESEKGKGTCFKFVLAFKPDESKEIVTKEEIAETVDIHGAKVLVVEDNDLNMEIARFILEDAGVETDTAINGYEAVEKFKNSPEGTYDMIFMDIMMPGLDGLSATRKIRAMDREDAQSIPIVAMSANAFAEDIRNAKEAGMNEHLAKPLDEKKVIQSVIRHVKKER